MRRKKPLNLTRDDLRLVKLMVRKHYIPTPQMRRIYRELERVTR